MELLIGDKDFMFILDDELNNFLPPADHFHLFFRVLEADVVVDELGLVVKFGEVFFERFLNFKLFDHKNYKCSSDD